MSYMGVAIGDPHLDKLCKYWPNANAMKCAAINRAVDYAIRQGCTHATILGDVADGIRDSTGNAMRLSEDGQIHFLDLIYELDSKIELDVILGNHDWADVGNHSLGVFMKMEQRGMFKRTRFHSTLTKRKIGRTKVAFMPFPNTTPPDGCHLAFAHYEVAGALGDNGRAGHSDFKAEFDIPIIQGHLHTKQKVRNHYYPGTLYQTSFGESLPKGFMIYQSDGSRFKQRWIETEPPFKLINLRVNSAKDFQQLTHDPLVLYKLFVHEDIGVPDSLLVDYPNIVNRMAFATEGEAEALIQEEYQSENHLIDLDHRKELPGWLKANGATRQQAKRGVEIVDNYHQG